MSDMHFRCGFLMSVHWFGHSRWLADCGQSMRHYITKMGTWRRTTGIREAFGTEPIFALARHDIITTGTFPLASTALNEAIHCLPLNTTDIYCLDISLNLSNTLSFSLPFFLPISYSLGSYFPSFTDKFCLKIHTSNLFLPFPKAHLNYLNILN